MKLKKAGEILLEICVLWKGAYALMTRESLR